MLPNRWRSFVHFGPDRDGHCRHEDRPLHFLRLAIMNARMRGDFSEVPAAIARAETLVLRPADMIALDVAKTMAGWYMRQLAADTAVARLRTAAVAAAESNWLYKHVGAAECTERAIAILALEGEQDAAWLLLNKLRQETPDEPLAQVVPHIAESRIRYQFDSPAAAIPLLRKAHAVALSSGDMCMIDVALLHLAVVYAVTGRPTDATHTLSEARIPLDILPPFWDDPELLEAELRWHMYTR